MTYENAIKAADPVAVAIALTVLIATYLGAWDALGWDESQVLTVAAMLFTLAAGIRAGIEKRRRDEADAGGVLR